MHRLLQYLRLGLLTAAGMLVGCSMEMDTDQRYTSRSFSSNGEQIYFTGRSQSGQTISFQRGSMHTQMHSSACVNCHGENREGGRRMYPAFWITTPPLTVKALLGTHDDGHGDHEAYTQDSLKLAITKGIDPSGEELDSTMPRWSLNEADLNDLVDYLTAGTVESHKNLTSTNNHSYALRSHLSM